MIDPRTKLTVIHDADGSFTDYSDVACDYGRDSFEITLNASDDYLYVGFRKPVNAVYAELVTPNTQANDLAFEYNNGTGWQALEVRDETRGLTRSGFITWESPEDQAQTTVNSTARYYVRCRPSQTHSATTIMGINLVFCDDATLKQEFFEITSTNMIPAGQNSHIMSHVAARNQIIEELRGRQYIKVNSSTGYENIDQWDLLDVYEVREAAKYKALSNIFFEVSESPDDKWYMKHLKYNRDYETKLNSLRISVDSDDNGAKDDSEKLQKMRVTRFTY